MIHYKDIDWKAPARLGFRLGFTKNSSEWQMAYRYIENIIFDILNKIKIFSIEAIIVSKYALHGIDQSNRLFDTWFLQFEK